MNRKFFAALASATMAFTASGSIAVFADDFVEESNVVDPGDVKPNPTKVVWNKENFGDLVGAGANVSYTASFTEPKENEEIETSKLDGIKTITINNDFKGEVKGLKYFANLETFTADQGKLTNESLDFAANTKLATLSVKKAPELSEITLPEPVVTEKDGKKEEKYSLKDLTLDKTKLTKLDLSAQETLVASETTSKITVTNNYNLKEVTLKKATSGTQAKVHTLDLSNNVLETVNLDNYLIKTKFDLQNNHMGALDLSKTDLTGNDDVTLGTQKFYIYEKAVNVNLKETFENLDVDYVSATNNAFNSETGIFSLKDTQTYKYDTKAKGTDKLLDVKLEFANPMNRLYNPNSGEHFYTADVKEKEALVKLGWNDEGYGWVAPKSNEGTADVYRLYNPNAGDHHYTMSKEERDTLVAYGWKDEGKGWRSADAAATIATQAAAGTFTNLPVYRQYNPYANGAGSHNYTTDKAESNYLVSLGWVYEGAAWTAKK